MKAVALVATLVYGADAEGLGHLLRSGHHDHGHGDHHQNHDEMVQAGKTGFGGGTMEQTFGSYKNLPVGEAELLAAGWTKHNSRCDPHLGHVWTEGSFGATTSKPLKLYTTAGGQPSGIGIIMTGQFGYGALPEEQQKWATEKPMVGPEPHTDLAHLDVAFRRGDIVCSGAVSNEEIGDVLILNPASEANHRHLPISENSAKAEGWHKGSCFDTMGWHWFLDKSAPAGQLSGKAAELFPVVTMYDNGKINAIFFAAWTSQVTIPFLATNEWEPLALPNFAMCKNLCDEDCTFEGTHFWSTMHIYFNDHKEVTCPKDLHCGLSLPVRGGCCEQSRADLVV